MARIEIVVRGKRLGAEGHEERRARLGGTRAVVAGLLAAVTAFGMAVAALVLGYLVAGLVIAAILVVVVLAFLRSVARTLRG